MIFDDIVPIFELKSEPQDSRLKFIFNHAKSKKKYLKLKNEYMD